MSLNNLKAITVVVAAIAALIAVRWVYFKILCIAKDKNLVDNPDARKLQKTPIPVMGGIAVFFGVAFGIMAGYTAGGMLGVDYDIILLPVLAAMVVMLYVGALDDIRGLSPSSRLLIESLTMVGLIYAGGGCIDTFHGLWGIGSFSWWIAVPLTIFVGVGIINAVNMIDGVNGLSSTLCLLSSGLYGIVFLKSGDVANATLAFSMAAALVPFMIHNIFGLRSRMFIGDAGTMVMGLLLTWFTISLLKSDSPITFYEDANNVNLIAFALAVLCVPVFDTLRVMTMRMVRKKSPFHPDKTHLHHIFINVGVSHFITTVSEVLIMVVVVLTWFLSVLFGVSIDGQLYIVVAAAVVFVWGTYAVLRYHASHHTKFLHALVNFSVKTHLGRTGWWKRFTAWLDAPEDKIRSMEEVNEQGVADANKVDPFDLMEEDRKKVLDFMKGRAEVMVYDIFENSGANTIYVSEILESEERRGTIRVIQRDSKGIPTIVTLS